MAQTTLRDYLQTTEDAISSGRISDALANCQQILQYYPNSLEVQRLLGEVYLAKGELAKAQQAFDWVITNDPENVIAYCSRALISERMSDYDTALDCYQQAYELSRGNSQIRSEFNQLSSKVGQQQFIFSRAGLARLYLRGDLLPQALQEWETVLTANPERLDARTGLLKTYWRKGLYDKVEQLAQQILNDVPGCLKALLLLAHVIHAQNMQMAQQLMEQARTLDPDMVMAQELFSDLMASQVRDPFLSLLKKAPAVLGEVQQSQPVAQMVSAPAPSPYSNDAYDNGSHTSSQFSDSLLTWENLDTIIEQRHEQPVPEASPFQGGISHTPAELSSWIPLQEEQLPANTNCESQLVTPAPLTNSEPPIQAEPMPTTTNQPTEQAQQEDFTARNAEISSELEHNEQSWYDQETFEMPEYSSWNSQPIETSSTDIAAWNVSHQNIDIPTPPAWLEMLTGSGWKSQEDNTAVEEEEEEDAASPIMSSNTDATPQIEDTGEEAQPLEQADTSSQNSHSSWDEQLTAPEAPQLVQDEDEDYSFGPAWLRSLGATSINDLLPQAEEEMQQNLSPEETGATAVRNNSAIQEPAQTDPFSTPTPPPPSAEIWLSQIAEQPSQIDQNPDTTLEALENDLRRQGFVPLEPGMLSTAPSDQEDTQEAEENEASRTSSAEARPGISEEEPLWPAGQISASPTFTEDAMPSPAPLAASDQQPEPVSVAHAYPAQYDPLLDADLETTMKRPVLRLQSMQPRSSVPHNQPGLKSSSNEQTTPNKASAGGLSNKERLIKGYQYQRAGAYDDAMQEYRVIIRNSPELLGEVISDLRALLKVAPKYAPGYRVLGDAYMRQGEYLQAMEAYNKALTMARKAKI